MDPSENPETTDEAAEFARRAQKVAAALAEADAGVFISHKAMLQWVQNLSGETDSNALQ